VGDGRLVRVAAGVLFVAAVVGGTVAGLVGRGGAAAAPAVSGPGGALAVQAAIVRVVKVVSPSVVQIEDRAGLGSGVVFDAARDIVTNAHVVAGARSFVVTSSNGKRYRASLVGRFAPDDLAVIRVTGAQLRPARFADSSRLEVGDIAVAIGNPLGLRSSVTDGIVSAFRQGVPEGGGVSLPSVIQTSAAINPGNSGGALADLQGDVIGIPTLAAIDPQLGGSAPGIGFAIPSNTVTDIAGQLVKHGHVVNSHRAFLGIEVGDTSGQGVYVGRVNPGGPAAKAGIRAGELLLSVAGRSTPTTDALSAVLSTLKPGEKVAVTTARQNGAKQRLTVTLGQYPG